MNVESPKIQQKYDDLDRLNKKLKNQTNIKKGELENVNKLYDRKVQNARAEGLKELSSERQQTQSELKEIYNERENKLEDLKEQLHKTSRGLKQERQKVETQHKNELRDMRHTQELKREAQFKRDSESAQKIDKKANQKIEQMKRDYRDKLDAIEAQTQDHLIQAQAKHERKRLGVDKEIGKSQASLNTENRMDKQRLERAQQGQLKEIKNQYKQLEADHKVIHENKLQKQQEHSEHLRTQNEKTFELKHDKLIKEHQALMNTTRQKLENEFQDLVDQHAKAKEVHARKIDDKFYQIQSIDPKIQDAGDSYIVKIEVPEHERDQVVVSPQKRELRVSLNRSFEQRVDSPDGQVQKNSRSELISRTLTTPEIMDSTQITEKYENGVLSFKINKA